ncbi:MAG: AhpC/TSA family protein [Tannerellaceae bacterium]|jgi:thiol-disulfide isomerase/thioredoxin|nr:AhpC/TSA family protein [Tannerellaceae bacterium]
MKKIFTFAAMLLCLASCNGNRGFRIAGTVDRPDLDGKYVYLYACDIPDAAPLDSAQVAGGSFTLKGVQDTPLLACLRLADGTVDAQRGISGGFKPYAPWFVLDNSELTVRLGENSSVEGSPENNELTAYVRKLEELYGNQAQPEGSNEAAIRAAEAALNALDRQAAAIHKDYILSHSNSWTGAKVFYDSRYILPEADQREIIAVAGEVFKAAPGIDKRITHLAVLEKVAVGKTFTDFEMTDPQNRPCKLSDYVGTGKITLIDFWASWCPPCRRSVPYLREIYAQYKDKGFEIVGVSLDRTQEAWVKGVEELQISWPQMSDLQYWNSAGAALYGVNSIPHTVLVDREGVIIAKNLSDEDLSATLATLFQ